MANVQEAVRRLTVESVPKGVTQTADQLKQLGAAHAGVTVESQKTERATMSMERRYVSIQRQLDGNFLRTQQMARIERDLNAALAQGLTTQARRNELLALAQQRFAATNTAVAMTNRTVGFGTHAWSQLSFQINDIATGLAMGQSPFQILAQQGGQVYQVLSMQPQGVGGSLRAIGQQLLGLLTPTRALILAFAAAGAAGYAFYRVFGDEAPATEKILEEHDRLIGLIKDSYSGAADQAARFYKESREVMLLQAQANQLGLQTQVREAGQGLAQRLLGPGPSARASYAPFAAVREQLMAGVDSGSPDLFAARQAIAEIGLSAGQTNPQVRELATYLLETTQESGDLAFKLRQAESMLALLEGRASTTQREILGLSNTQSSASRKLERDAEREEEYLRRTAEQRASKLRGLELEGRALFMTAQEAERLALIEEELARLRERGIAETPQLVSEIEQWAETYARIAEENRRVAEMLDLGRETFSGFLSDFRSGLREGEGAWDSFANAASRALDRVADKLFDLATEQLWQGILGGLGGFGGFGGVGGGTGFAVNPWSAGGQFGNPWMGVAHAGGIAGSLTHGRYVHPAYFENAPRYHNGGVAGLRPNEVPAILERGERIVPRGGGGGSGVTVAISIGNISLPEDDGSDPSGATRSREVARAMRASVEGIVREELVRQQRPRGMLPDRRSI